MHKTLLFVTGLAALVSACAWAADDPFAGTWKLNRDKSQITGQVQRIKRMGGDKYEWSYGDSRVEIVTDGADHPFQFGGTMSVKPEAPGKWVLTHKQNGQIVSIDTWSLSDGGRQWNSEMKGTRADGSSFTVQRTRTRMGSGSGFTGSWELKNARYSAPIDWVIKPYGREGLSFRWPQDKEQEDIKFDGQDYPDRGPRVAPGSTVSAKRIDGRTIRTTDKLNGKIVETHQLKVSEDGGTLTDTIYVPGQQKPVIVVFEKQM